MFVSFQMLDSGKDEHPVTVAVTANNKPLNRFANITVCKLYMKWKDNNNCISEEWDQITKQ